MAGFKARPAQGYPYLVERLFRQGTVSGASDGDLLGEFVSRRNDSAFEAIVIRHGPMVFRVCRQLLHDPNDADDAFQATFLILASKAGMLRHPERLGNWLYGVAFRVASRARTVAARHSTRIRPLDLVDPREIDNAVADDLHRSSTLWLHEEVNRLSEKYRTPIVLCYFEGLTHEEASVRLRWPLGTLKLRLNHAKDLLRQRLSGYGLDREDRHLSTQLKGETTLRVVPPLLLARTVRSVVDFKGHSLVAVAGHETISHLTLDLVQGVSRAMSYSRLRAGTFIGAAGIGATLLTGMSVIALQEDGPAANQAKPSVTSSKQATKTTALPQAEFRNASDGAAKQEVPVTHSQQAAETKQKSALIERGDGTEGPLRGTNMVDSMILPANARLVSMIEEADQSPRSKSTIKLLERTLIMPFANPTPLGDVLKYIRAGTQEKDSSGLPIFVDPRGLEDSNETLKSDVMIELEGVPLRTTLHLILNQLHLSYCIRDGVVVISSVGGIRRELMQIGAQLGIPEESIPKPKFPQVRGGMQSQAPVSANPQPAR